MNSIGQIFRLTTFGESHGPAIGGVIDGMPAGVAIDLDAVQRGVDRRRPGHGTASTSRAESDRVEILSGLFDGVTTGAPIGFIVRNEDCRPADYDELKDAYRPSHADFTYDRKYGLRDWRGGGRSSARETVARVVAGAFARQALATVGIEVAAYASRIGEVAMPDGFLPIAEIARRDDDVMCPDAAVAQAMKAHLLDVRGRGDTVGGVVSCVISGAPAGLGEPVYDKLSAMLGAAMLSINACKGVEIGMGFAGAARLGSEMADPFVTLPDGTITTATNHSGGIQGGISNGAPIELRLAFKPVATMMRDIATVRRDGSVVTLPARGRHDVCVVPRAVPVVEAMAACVMLDALLLDKTTRL